MTSPKVGPVKTLEREKENATLGIHRVLLQSCQIVLSSITSGKTKSKALQIANYMKGFCFELRVQLKQCLSRSPLIQSHCKIKVSWAVFHAACLQCHWKSTWPQSHALAEAHIEVSLCQCTERSSGPSVSISLLLLLR